MNTWIKRLAAAAGVTTALALPIAGQASDGTITFTGAITANTCSIQVNGAGTGNGAVTLPTVDMAALTNAVGRTTAAGTFFSIDLSACTIPTVADIATVAPTNVRIYFEAGPNVNPVTGGLINTDTVTGSNVEVNLYNASSAGTIVGTQILPGTGTQPANQAIIADPALQWFYAGYSTAGAAGAATAGAVSTSVTYSLVYS
jgi:major type 1 subunit fimbrin (pilin)